MAKNPYRRVLVDAQDPCALMLGQPHSKNRTAVYEHKLVLFRKLGPGQHECNWCGKPLKWKRGNKGDAILADHLDGDRSNNSPDNLVPACNGCNVMRGRTTFRPSIQPGELTVLNSKGQRTRAVQRTCEMCEAEFLAPIDRVKAGYGNTCSKQCASAKGLRRRWAS